MFICLGKFVASIFFLIAKRSDCESCSALPNTHTHRHTHAHTRKKSSPSIFCSCLSMTLLKWMRMTHKIWINEWNHLLSTKSNLNLKANNWKAIALVVFNAIFVSLFASRLIDIRVTVIRNRIFEFIVRYTPVSIPVTWPSWFNITVSIVCAAQTSLEKWFRLPFKFNTNPQSETKLQSFIFQNQKSNTDAIANGVWWWWKSHFSNAKRQILPTPSEEVNNRDGQWPHLRWCSFKYW